MPLTQTSSNFYNILNIPISATSEQIKKAYKHLAIKHHPDKSFNLSDSKQEKINKIDLFHKIKVAFEVLNDPKKRHLYDVYGEFSLTEDFLDTQVVADLAEAFSVQVEFDRRRTASSTTTAAAATNIRMTPTFSEEGIDSFSRSESTSQTSSLNKSYQQHATVRFKMGQDISTQTELSTFKKTSFTPNKEFMVYVTLEDLMHGCVKKVNLSRKIETDKNKFEDFTLHLKIKAGTSENERIVFTGQADQDLNKYPGDVIFIIKIKKHVNFERNGNDLIYEQTISLSKCLSGEEQLFVIPTLDETESGVKKSLDLIIADEVISCKSVKVFDGYGFPVGKRGSSERGCLRVKFNILFPTGPIDKNLMKISKKLDEM